MYRIRLAFAFVLFTSLCAHAQTFPFYSQYVFNPYVINPAFVAINRQAEINATYRRQWANIEDGPKTMQFDIQYPFSPRVAAGLNVYEDRTVLLSSTTVMLTYGYKVPLATDHILGFGLSGGVISNRLRTQDLNAIDLSDPSLFNATNNTMSLDGQFGAYYNFKKLYLGFSLIRLVDNRIVSEDAFQKEIKFSQLENKIAYASYQFDFANGTWGFKPSVMYRFAQANQNFFEATGVISYDGLIDIGGGYRQDFGPMLMARLNLARLEVGFAYDFPSALPQVSTGGTYEAQLKYRFGKVTEAPAKRPRKEVVAVVPEETTPVETPKEEPKQEEVKEEPKQEPKEEPKQEIKEEPKQETVQQQPVTQETTPPTVVQEPPIIREEVKTPPKGGFHLVIGAFRDPQHAENFLKSVREKGYKAEIYRGKDITYVHLPQHHTTVMNPEAVRKIRGTTPFTDAWYTPINE